MTASPDLTYIFVIPPPPKNTIYRLGFMSQLIRCPWWALVQCLVTTLYGTLIRRTLSCFSVQQILGRILCICFWTFIHRCVLQTFLLLSVCWKVLSVSVLSFFFVFVFVLLSMSVSYSLQTRSCCFIDHAYCSFVIQWRKKICKKHSIIHT